MTQEFESQFPVLPLRDLVVYPNMIVPLFIGRDISVKALDASDRRQQIILVAQKSPDNEKPKPNDLYKVGIVANVLQVLRLQNSNIKVLVEGVKRVKINKLTYESGLYFANCKSMYDEADESKNEDVEALRMLLVEQFKEYVKLNDKTTPEVAYNISQIKDCSKFADSIASNINIQLQNKQDLLEEVNVQKRMEKLLTYLQSAVNLLHVKSRISKRVRHQLDEKNRHHLLNEHLIAIHKELGDDSAKDEIVEIAKKIKSTKMPLEAREKLDEELKRLKAMSAMSNEANLVRDYIKLLLDLPWEVSSPINHDIKKAEDVLEKDHYGLEKIKERILEYIAVMMKTVKHKSPILCLVGPPGVGKTSLAQSIAAATGRKFVKIALGGLRDEAEIRGHRKTYIGAMPGKIVNALKKAKANNPVVLLDEIDKVGMDHRGDPASALLEALDPEQNKNFNDHYVEVDIDLSQVLFIATSNSYNIPKPLLDRMEVIEVSGYTEDEKLKIAEKYLLEKQLEEHGLDKKEVKVGNGVLREIIRHYTREAGVRNLNRSIAKIMRKVVKQMMAGSSKCISVTKASLEKYLGAKKYLHGEIESKDLVGITNGLAYSEVGGDLLAIEVITTHGGKGDIKITGKLGDVMKESAQAALSYIKSKCFEFGIHPDMFNKRDIHIHVPEGATPKEGPSAGIAICTSIISALTGLPVNSKVGMTGEITLRGRVLPIGGLKEKLLAAIRGGVEIALIPEENRRDLAELPKKIKDNLQIIPVKSFEEVMKHALIEQPKEIVMPKDYVFPLSHDSSDSITTH